MSLRRLLSCCVLLMVVLRPLVGYAHQLPPEVITFIKVDEGHVRVLVRVPTAILTDARLPLVETVYLDLRALDDRLRTIAPEVARALELTDRGQLLSPASTSWVVSPLADGSFVSFEAAQARLEQPPIPFDQFVYWNEAFADFKFDYVTAGGLPQVTARINGLRMGGDFFQTRATYVPPGGAPRTLTVVGSPQRVAFEPPAGDAIASFARLGLDRLLGDTALLLLLVCLAVPERPLTPALKLLGAFVVAHALSAGIVAGRGVPLSGATLDAAQVVAGLALVAGAAQNILQSGPAARGLMAVLFGMAMGLGLGSSIAMRLPLAGSHATLGVVAWLAVAEMGMLWGLGLLHPLARIPYRWRAPAWLVVAALSAIPAHEGAHAALDAAFRLRQADLSAARPALYALLTHWPVLALGSALLVLFLLSRAGGRQPWTARRSQATP